jgi:hypothetical protein
VTAPQPTPDRCADCELQSELDAAVVGMKLAQEKGIDLARQLEAANERLVLDPSSPELVERVTDVLWMHVIFRDRNTGREVARAILADLSTSQSEEQS